MAFKLSPHRKKITTASLTTWRARGKSAASQWATASEAWAAYKREITQGGTPARGYMSKAASAFKAGFKSSKKRNPSVPTTWITAKIRRKGNTIQALIPTKR